jgi:galactokinase/mevalonate kinase-like predicted kinase
LSVQAERTVGVTGGTQDQWASAHGGLGIVRQHGERGKRIPISSSQEFLSYLMLVHPGGTRDSSAIVEAVIAQSKLRRSRSVIAAMNSAALQLEAAIGLNDVSSAFDLMNESRNLLLQLNERIVSITIQELIEAAPGVLGSKPCGAGGESAAWIVAVEPDARRSFSDFIRSRGPLVSIAEASPSGVRKIAHGRT